MSLIIWSIIPIVFGWWGLAILDNSCQNNSLFINLRIMLVSSAVVCTMFTANLLCNNACYDEDDSTHMFVPLCTVVLSVIIWITGAYIYNNISDCTGTQSQADSYKQGIMYACILPTAGPCLYGLWRIADHLKNKGKIKETAEKKKQAKIAEKIGKEDKKRREQEIKDAEQERKDAEDYLRRTKEETESKKKISEHQKKAKEAKEEEKRILAEENKKLADEMEKNRRMARRQFTNEEMKELKDKFIDQQVQATTRKLYEKKISNAEDAILKAETAMIQADQQSEAYLRAVKVYKEAVKSKADLQSKKPEDVIRVNDHGYREYRRE